VVIDRVTFLNSLVGFRVLVVGLFIYYKFICSFIQWFIPRVNARKITSRWCVELVGRGTLTCNNDNNNNCQEDVYSSVIMADPL